MKRTAVILSIIVLVAGFAAPAEKKVAEGEGMSGIVFFNTQKLTELTSFYVNEVGCRLWQDQGDCKIFRFGNMLFGFCRRQKVDPGGLLTFFYEERQKVDRMYERFKEIALDPPKANKKYAIYHFFARDPEGRLIEFQYFENPIDWNFDRYE